LIIKEKFTSLFIDLEYRFKIICNISFYPLVVWIFESSILKEIFTIRDIENFMIGYVFDYSITEHSPVKKSLNENQEQYHKNQNKKKICMTFVC